MATDGSDDMAESTRSVDSGALHSWSSGRLGSAPAERAGCVVAGTAVAGTAVAGAAVAEFVPTTGERFEPVVRFGDIEIEQIVSSASVEPADYDQDHDEWVLVTAGAATMIVAGEEVELVTGDWVLLPAHTPHRVVRTDAGTVWLAVHRHPV